MTFEDIARANAEIVTTPIYGKEYAEVNQRVKAFRMVYPDGSIECYADDPAKYGLPAEGVCVIVAEVKDGDGCHLATGMAYEKLGSTNINKTSFVENCQTSAVGRALGFAGFGIDTSIASADEVTEAIRKEPVDKVKIDALREQLKTAGMSEEGFGKLLAQYGISSFEEITEEIYSSIAIRLNRQEGKR